MKIESLFPHVAEEHRQIGHAIELLEKAIANLRCDALNNQNLDAASCFARLAVEHLGMIHQASKKATRETA